MLKINEICVLDFYHKIDKISFKLYLLSEFFCVKLYLFIRKLMKFLLNFIFYQKIDEICVKLYLLSELNWIWNSPVVHSAPYLRPLCITIHHPKPHPEEHLLPVWGFSGVFFLEIEKKLNLYSIFHILQRQNRMMKMKMPRKGDDGLLCNAEDIPYKGSHLEAGESWKDFWWKEDFRLPQQIPPPPCTCWEKTRPLKCSKILLWRYNWRFAT